MAKLRITQEDFIQRAEGLHPTYDFSKFQYLGNAVKSTVICPAHGEFDMNPNALSNRQGCPKCAVERRTASRTWTFDMFLEKARKAHGDAYEYDSSEWSGMARKIRIRCPKHDLEFSQRADVHVNRRSGCPKCASSRTAAALKDSQEGFISKCVSVHGETYDLSRVLYKSSVEKIEVLCRTHGAFYPQARNFINRRSGCPKCAADKASERSRLPPEKYLRSFREVHGDKYKYAEIFYIKQKAVVRAECPEHGEFVQHVSDHLSGHGCKRCSGEVWDTETFIASARKVHGDRYDYSGSVYTRATDKVIIRCAEHGDFEQGATYHVNNGHGCPRCGKIISSKAQTEISNLLSPHTRVVDNYVMPSGKHIDIYMPDLNLGVEYHGLIWHSERFKPNNMRDFAKHKEAAALGIRLIHIYSDEWDFRGHVVKAMLLRLVGVKQEKVHARKCSIALVSDEDALVFYENNHIQGHVNSPCYHIGLEHKQRLVALMSFSRLTSIRGSADDPAVRELRRYATSCTVVGGASKLMTMFLRSFPEVLEVVSYSDNRMFSGGMYKALGFKLDSVSEPSYCYVHPSVKWREEKHKFTRSRLVGRKEFVFDPSKSEKENCEANNWFRVYDCGKTKWVFRK